MSDEVKPALSAEEWKNPDWNMLPGTGKILHEMAALCLHGQPFGFTWADVDGIRAVLEDEYNGGPGFEHITGVAELMSLAQRISALLPPREEASE